MIIHHPDRGTFHSIETLITRQVGQFWKAYPGQFSKAPKRIKAKIRKHARDNIRSKHSLDEFDLLCFYCDEAALYNTPFRTVEFGFRELGMRVQQALAGEPRVFDRIFLFHPDEDPGTVQVYSGNS